MKIDRILETSLYVPDLDRAQAFYEDVLGLVVYSAEPGRHVFFKLGNGMLLLFDPVATRQSDGDLPPHGDVGPGHLAFCVTPEEVPQWRQRLLDAGVPIETERVWPNGAPSLYFRDPAGNVLEITTADLWGYESTPD